VSPTVFREGAYRLFFFSNEGNPLEPIHVHIRRDNSLAKFWLEPKIIIAENYGFNSKELKIIERIIKSNEQKIRSKWHQYFG
tara:strand:+ start:561 stop:806 length:246 start_codon:yes stop_codon:yes gene_type:complete